MLLDVLLRHDPAGLDTEEVKCFAVGAEAHNSSGYLERLLANEAVFRFLSKKHHDMLTEFSSIVRVTSLDK